MELQKGHDPLGYAVFGNVKGAALAGVAAKAIVLENLKGGKIHNETVARFTDCGSGPLATPNLILDALKSVTSWEEVLRHLTENTEVGREWVLGFVQQLRGTGISAIRIGDLVAAVAARVRADWATRHAAPADELAREGEDEYEATVRMVWPVEGLEARERWEQLKRVIPDRIAHLDRQERVRERLARVFAALVAAVEGSEPDPPSQADLTERTGVPRATLSDDFRLLREIIDGLESQNPDA